MFRCLFSEAVFYRCSSKYVLLKISQNPQKNTRVRVFFNKVAGDADKMFSCEFCEICKNTFFDRKPPVAASIFNSFMTEAVII